MVSKCTIYIIWLFLLAHPNSLQIKNIQMNGMQVNRALYNISDCNVRNLNLKMWKCEIITCTNALFPRGSHKLESPWGSFRLRPSVPLSAKVILSLGFFTITACSNGKCQNDRSDHEVVSISFFWLPLCFGVSTDGFQIFNRGGALWKDLLLPSDWRVWLISFLSSFPPHSYCEWADLATSWEDLPHCSYH